MSDAKPVDQIQYWNETAGPKWVRYQEMLDAQIGAIGRAAMDRAAVGEGERVLDVGCGCGGTTLELAERVGAGGRVTGVDVSAPMLEHARQRLERTGKTNVSFERADAQTHRFEAGSFDVLFSRFGVMFFPDPAAAFGNLHRALRKGGRLSFVCWQEIQKNQWILVPLMAIAPHVALPPPPAPGEPGPFSFADPDRVRKILGDAGFRDVEVRPFESEMTIASGQTLDQAVDFVMQLGPTSAVLKDADDATKRVVTGAVREALAPYAAKGPIRLGAACWLVTATA